MYPMSPDVNWDAVWTLALGLSLGRALAAVAGRAWDRASAISPSGILMALERAWASRPRGGDHACGGPR